MEDFEKLGVLYLGRHYDQEANAPLPRPLLYDARDLTTHAVCLGMTGSGKTGLCLSLLEEAAIDGIPALVIDLKGDLGNLLLTFPALTGEQFAPWVEPEEAARAGLSPAEYAEQVAASWRAGLADSGQDGARIARFAEAVERTIYTPGARFGLPLAVFHSLAAPGPELLADADALLERVEGAASSILALLGLGGDPLQSREQVLLANLFEHAWRAGQGLDLATLVQQIQRPPFARLGVLELDTFYPPRERMALAMRLNNLLASPGFSAWLQGEPLDVARLLRTPAGKPRLTILSLAHLDDAERMFFVTLLLEQVVGWMRSQPGTSSLRALLYMDEVAGYLPPVAMPPSKRPLLTLLKQARAFGLGVVLATQNPVDLDYKALSNAGTWFLGRLQTERDQARVLDGLEGAAGEGGQPFDRAELGRRLAALQKRVFLLHDVHATGGPTVFQSRWTLSYLRGPLSRPQIQRLCEARRAAAPPPAAAPAALPVAPLASPAVPPPVVQLRPLLPDGVPVTYLPALSPLPAGTTLVYRPALLAAVRLHYLDPRADLDHWQPLTLLAALPTAELDPDWSRALALRGEPPRLDDQPLPGGRFAELAAPAPRPASLRRWETTLERHLRQERPLPLLRCTPLALVSRPGEAAGEFAGRVDLAAREQRDQALAELRRRFAPRLERVEQQLARAEQRLGREQAQLQQRRTDGALDLGGAVFGALLGRGLSSSRTLRAASASARAANRAAAEQDDVELAEQGRSELQARLDELQAELAAEAERLRAALDPASLPCTDYPVLPKKSDVTVLRLAVAWIPYVSGGAQGDRPVIDWR